MEKQREGGSQKLVQKAKQREKVFFFFLKKGGGVGIRGRAAEGEAHNEAVLGRQHEGQ